MNIIYNNFESFVKDVAFNRIFRMLEYRHPGDWTPYEQERKFRDENRYVSSMYTHIQIKEVIVLPNNDVLIGYSEILDYEDFNNADRSIYYRKLSQIELSFHPEDMDEENW